MCLIIQRPANIKLDFEKFKIAVENNPDGYGISVPDGNGSLLTIRDHNKPDPEQLYKFIHEEFKDQHTMIHLRYTTAGDTNLRNAHPFPILEKSKDGVDLRMAHNGTLGKWKGNTGESDTRRFVRGFVRPLFKRLIRAYDSTELLTDPFINELLDAQLTLQSVLTFVDGFGNTLEVNALGNGGMYSEHGTYYSNKYSFDPDHRKPWPSYSGYAGQNYAAGYYSSPKNTTAKPPAVVAPMSEHAKDTQVPKFSDEYAIPSEDFCSMSDDFIDDLVDNDVNGAKLLIKELLFELQKAEDALETKQ